MGSAEDFVRARRQEESKSEERLNEARALEAAADIEELIPKFLEKMQEIGYPETSGMYTTKIDGEEYLTWDLYFSYGEGDISGIQLSLLSTGALMYNGKVFDMVKAIESRTPDWKRLPGNRDRLQTMLESWSNPDNVNAYNESQAKRAYYYEHGVWPEKGQI